MMGRELEPTSFDALSGWAADDHDAALSAFQRSSREIIDHGHGFQRPSRFGGAREDWLPACEAGLKARGGKIFFETHFTPFKVHDRERPTGLFTGYYEPELRGSLTPNDAYPVPVYAKPGYIHQPFFTRREIEEGALKDQGLELCYVSNWVDAFFMHVQGNGRVVLPDGSIIRLSFAGKSGRAYTGIGSVLLKRGIGAPQTMSMQFLREWMAANPNDMRALLWENESFIFFRVTEISDSKLGAIGAAKVNLTPRRSLAVDRSLWAFGTPLFLDTNEPPEAGGASFNRLMIAQDTGTAIRGLVRGDVYWGWGAEAEHKAGHMKSTGRMVALLPKTLVLA